MEAINPCFEREWSTASGHEFRIMRRSPATISDLASDLEPLKYISSLWSYRFRNVSARNVIGVLTSLDYDESSERYILSSRDEHVASKANSEVTMEFIQPIRRLLTIWRVNDLLDMIQLVVKDDSHYMYVQVGGQESVSLMFGADRTGDKAIITLRRIFLECVRQERIA